MYSISTAVPKPTFYRPEPHHMTNHLIPLAVADIVMIDSGRVKA